MKILFFAGNDYIYAEPFSRIMAALSKKGIRSELRYLYKYNNCDNIKDQCDNKHSVYSLKKLPVIGPTHSNRGLIRKFGQFLLLVINKYLMSLFLKIKKPDMVVVGGDVDDAHNRLFLDLCRRYEIKVFIVPLIISGHRIANPDPDKAIPMSGFVRRLLKTLRLDRAVFFRGWVIGSYHETAYICVHNEEMRDLLLNNGIDASRIVQCGNPLYDELYERSTMPDAELMRFRREYCYAKDNSKLIVYCTELIQSILGNNYLSRINNLLKKEFDGLPVECKVIIKMHPREPDEIKRHYETVFSGNRYRIVRDMDVITLMKAANLVIGHYTAAIRNAALLGTPVLSIKMDDNQTPYVFGDADEYTYIRSEKDINRILYKMLYDDKYRKMACNYITKWKENNIASFDGHNSERVADYIEALCN